MPPAYAGQELEAGYTPAYRQPVFDIVIKPQKRSPYSKMAQNELAKEMYHMAFFDPTRAEQTMGALELMDFDGIEKVKERVQQGQTLFNAVQQLMQENMMLKATMGMPAQGLPAQQTTPNATPSGMGAAQKNAMTSTMTSYGERLAENAKPDMNAQ